MQSENDVGMIILVADVYCYCVMFPFLSMLRDGIAMQYTRYDPN